MDKTRRRSRLPASIQEELLQQFVAGATARVAAELLQINRNTAILYFRKLRELIAIRVAADTPFLSGEIELDESYFGGARKGQRGRGAAGKVIVFGLLKRGGKVHTLVVHDTKSNALILIICQKIQPDSIVYTDCYRSYDVLDVSEFRHHRIRWYSHEIFAHIMMHRMWTAERKDFVFLRYRVAIPRHCFK
jgi:transposase